MTKKSRKRRTSDYHGPIPTSEIPTQVFGDIINPLTWEKLDQSIKNRSIPSFDFIALRPVVGWRKINSRSESGMMSTDPDQHVLTLSYIVRNVISRLSPDGRFYFDFELPGYLGNFENLNKHPDIKELIADIKQSTPYKLILLPTKFDGVTTGLSGALVPK